MSNGRRTRRHLTRRAHEKRAVAARCAFTIGDDPNDIEEAKRVSHDQLIAQLGRHRRSGVRWVIAGPDERGKIIDELDSSAPAATQWFAENPGGFLVVAMADAVTR